MRKKIFVSFDYENDRHYKFLLNAWSEHSNFDFVFRDYSSQEIDSDNIGRVKAGLALKIKMADYTLVLVGKEANKLHKDHKLIGHRNWINFEVAKSKESGNKLIAVKLDPYYESPEELLGANATWAMKFEEDSILKALHEAEFRRAIGNLIR